MALILSGKTKIITNIGTLFHYQQQNRFHENAQDFLAIQCGIAKSVPIVLI